MTSACVYYVCSVISQGALKGTHCQGDVDDFGEAIQCEGDDSKGNVCSQDAQTGNGGQVSEEGLLPHRQPSIQDDGRQKEAACIA